MVKFKVMSSDEIIEQKIPNYTLYQDARDSFGSFCWAIVEFDDDDNPLRIVGEDGGEPEDQKLVRDWKWVEEELNLLADKERELKQGGMKDGKFGKSD
ncbi:MAG: hypothetical protein ACTSRU_16230 [Candidatus Hodarchaeales archaeon]